MKYATNSEYIQNVHKKGARESRPYCTEHNINIHVVNIVIWDRDKYLVLS